MKLTFDPTRESKDRGEKNRGEKDQEKKKKTRIVRIVGEKKRIHTGGERRKGERSKKKIRRAPAAFKGTGVRREKGRGISILAVSHPRKSVESQSRARDLARSGFSMRAMQSNTARSAAQSTSASPFRSNA